MKFRFAFILILIGSFGFSQIDKNSRPIKLTIEPPKIITPEQPKFSPDLPSIEYKSILNTEDKPSRYSILKTKTEPTKSILDTTNTDYKNPGDEIRDKLNNEIAKEGAYTDVYFGKFKVHTSSIKIKTKDFADPDGDRVRFELNTDVMYANELLESFYKTYVINLREGDNLLDIMALNQGTDGPNTAYFAIYDENDNLVTSNEWNLKTGVSAKFTIEYVKGLGQ